MTMRRLAPTALLAATALAGSLLLTGCVNPLEVVVDQVLKNEGVDFDTDGDGVTITGEDGSKLELGSGATLPDSFPSSIPLPEGTLVATFASDGMWTVSYEGVDRDRLDALSSKLEQAGHTQKNELVTADTVLRNYESDEFLVSITWEGASDTPTLIYGVQKNL